MVLNPGIDAHLIIDYITCMSRNEILDGSILPNFLMFAPGFVNTDNYFLFLNYTMTGKNTK